MLIVPLQALPSQVISVQLAAQACEIWVYQKPTGLYLDLYVNDLPIVIGALCENKNRLVRYPYLGFTGDLFFGDTQGEGDPVFTGLGDRFELAYLEASDYPTQ